MNVSAESETVEMMRRKRRKRTIITPEQLLKLEELYKQEQWPARDRKEELAQEIEMSSHFVNIWFQNKRSRIKKLAQEEEEIKAMKSRVNVSPYGNTKVLLAPKSDVKSTISKSDNDLATHQSVPVISAPIQSVMPAVGGLPVFSISTRNGSSPAPSVLTSLPQLAVPLIPQNTIFATIPQSASLQRKDPVSRTPSTTKSSTRSSKTKVKHVATHSSSAHPPKRFKSTSVKTLSTSLSSSTDLNKTMKRSAMLQQTQPPITLSSTSGPVHDLQCKMKITSNRTQDASNNAPAPMLASSSAPACDSPTKVISTSAMIKDATNNAPAPTLLHCMILMMALSELPCSVPKDSTEFDLAVCAALYGVRLEKGNVLTYNKQDGFHVGKVVRKSKKGKGKKKKKRKTGKNK